MVPRGPDEDDNYSIGAEFRGEEKVFGGLCLDSRQGIDHLKIETTNYNCELASVKFTPQKVGVVSTLNLIQGACPGQSISANRRPDDDVIVENPKSSVFLLTSDDVVAPDDVAWASNADVDPISAILRVNVVFPESTWPRIPILRAEPEVEGADVIW
ncbi:hypothetical protein GCK72_003427 [Caenorhabditis remanei]|uniref:Uncharacterized protein n=1 Tax=Caenorhabditis remanei TaxID=31234 RepID=A0A6A5HTQ0_CAERE|nr:hypothetical protein GCK72_003427 [Caenorhabditis remanei]KAF1771600.1 hypothetical protein GCK72_003427 [Caenorhabditis remanei]